MRRLILAALLASLPYTALSAMPVSTFLIKAAALKKKGPLALFSGDYRLLKTDVNDSAKALGAEQAAAKKAGRTPATCMPGKISIGTDELLNHFQAIPPAERTMSVKDGLKSFVNKKYPCPTRVQ